MPAVFLRAKAKRKPVMSTAPPIPGENPTYQDYARCVHCGLCLNACPTYRLWHLEADSPRGRIHQMISVSQGEIAKPEQAEPANGEKSAPADSAHLHGAITASFVDHIDKCLDCRACETVCPSAVEYGKLVEHARAVIERDYQRPFFTRLARRLVFRELLPHPHRIAIVARILRFYQRFGLQSLARETGILKLLGLAGRELLLPRIDDSFFFKQLGRTFPALGPRRARVAFFAGCVAQVTFTQLNDATIRVLTGNGCEVVVPRRSAAVELSSAHAGVRDAARDLARKNLAAFPLENFDAIITNAAGCGSRSRNTIVFSLQRTGTRAGRRPPGKSSRRPEILESLGLSVPLQPLKPLTLRSPTRTPATSSMGKKSATLHVNFCALSPA